MGASSVLVGAIFNYAPAQFGNITTRRCSCSAGCTPLLKHGNIVINFEKSSVHHVAGALRRVVVVDNGSGTSGRLSLSFILIVPVVPLFSMPSCHLPYSPSYYSLLFLPVTNFLCWFQKYPSLLSLDDLLCHLILLSTVPLADFSRPFFLPLLQSSHF